MMWIFEWDIVTGDSAVLDVIYEVSRDELDEAIAGGDRADRRGRAHARRDRGDGCRDLARPGAAHRVPRHPRLPGQHATPCSATTARCSCARRSGTTPATPPRTTQWDAARRAFEASAAAHEAAYAGDPYCPPTTSPPPSSASSAPSATCRWRGPRASLLVLLAAWLGYGIAAGSAARALARRRAPPARSGWRPRGRGARRRSTDGLGRARPGARRGGAGARARREPRHPDLVPRPGAPARDARRLARLRARAARSCSDGGSAWPVLAARRRRRAAARRAAARRARARPGPAATGSASGPTRSPARSTSPSRSRAFGWVFVAGGLGARRAGRRRRAPWARCVAGGGRRARGVRRARRRDRARGGADRRGTTRWRCCRGGCRASSASRVYLDIPADTAWWAAIAGGARRRRRDPGGRRRPGPAQQRTGRRVARLTPTRAGAGQRFCPMSQSRSGRPSIASDTARAWSSESEAT